MIVAINRKTGGPCPLITQIELPPENNASKANKFSKRLVGTTGVLYGGDIVLELTDAANAIDFGTFTWAHGPNKTIGDFTYTGTMVNPGQIFKDLGASLTDSSGTVNAVFSISKWNVLTNNGTPTTPVKNVKAAFGITCNVIAPTGADLWSPESKLQLVTGYSQNMGTRNSTQNPDNLAYNVFGYSQDDIDAQILTIDRIEVFTEDAAGVGPEIPLHYIAGTDLATVDRVTSGNGLASAYIYDNTQFVVGHNGPNDFPVPILTAPQLAWTNVAAGGANGNNNDVTNDICNRYANQFCYVASGIVSRIYFNNGDPMIEVRDQKNGTTGAGWGQGASNKFLITDWTGCPGMNIIQGVMYYYPLSNHSYHFSTKLKVVIKVAGVQVMDSGWVDTNSSCTILGLTSNVLCKNTNGSSYVTVASEIKQSWAASNVIEEYEAHLQVDRLGNGVITYDTTDKFKGILEDEY